MRLMMLSPKPSGEVEQPESVEPAGIMAGAVVGDTVAGGR